MSGHLIADETDAPTCPPGSEPLHTWPRLEAILQKPLSLPRWVGWRLKAMVAIVVLAMGGILLLAHWLAGQPRFPFSLSVTPTGEVRLDTADYPPLRPLEGRLLKGIALDHEGGEHTPAVEAPIPPLALFPSGRWLLDEEGLSRFIAGHVGLSNALDQWSPSGVTVRLKLHGHADEPILIAPRGWTGITAVYWVLAALSLVVASMGAMVMLANADWRYGGFALLAMTQSGNLLLMALESNLGLFTPIWLLSLDTTLRALFDLLGAAGLVHIALLNSTPAPHRWGIKAAAAWLTALALWAMHGTLPAAQAWWLLQLGCGFLAMCAIGVTWSEQRRLPHPLNLLMRRVLLIGVLTWGLLSLAVWLTRERPDLNLEISTWGVAGWQAFVTSMVLIAPYFSRTRQVQREFMLLAASGTVAASLDLLFIAVFSMGQLASMAISLMLSMGLYLSFRRWLLTQLPRPDSLSMEQVFQQLYRIARQIELQPESASPAMSRLMRDLFDPLDVTVAEGLLNQVTLEQDGALMLVPVPSLVETARARRAVLVIKHARRGQHLFTRDDCALAQRIVEQLQRALSFDQAVEQGRSEERLRIAQDLHDDIGARLLTLMYQAPSPEIEEYIRHTIQDLKTLTRGLAAHTHCLSQAAGEWKSDISHRLSVARCELDWQVKLEREIGLNVVQWSALTRILRELVSNVISHAQARRVQVHLSLQDGVLRLTVSDDGVGTAPEAWSHGLGLGGVRKRAKQLGGSVRWSVREPHGVCCEVEIPNFAGACPEDQVDHASGQASH